MACSVRNVLSLGRLSHLSVARCQVWYCVSPKDRGKFEKMAQSLFPEDYQSCRNFMRHKDTMFSPKVLRSYHIDFVQASQLFSLKASCSEASPRC